MNTIYKIYTVIKMYFKKKTSHQPPKAPNLLNHFVSVGSFENIPNEYTEKFSNNIKMILE